MLKSIDNQPFLDNMREYVNTAYELDVPIDQVITGNEFTTTSIILVLLDIIDNENKS